MKKIKFDMNQFLIEAEEKRQQELKDLKSRSKPLYDLVVSEDFTVHDIIGESYVTSSYLTLFTPLSETIPGGIPPVCSGGFTSKLVLKVTPNNRDIPVRTLNFDGNSAVRPGDYIIAKIPKYKEKKVSLGYFGSCFSQDRIFYFDRDFNPEEFAIELIIPSEKGKRTDRAVNYENFIKK